MSLFVDTSIWYAAVDSSDLDNVRAKTVLRAGEPLVTTDHVLVESWRLIRHRLHRRAADRFWEELRSGLAIIETIGPAWKDQDFSIVDRTSFAVMLRLGIERAASLDDHFAVFRFGPAKRRAFTILN
jgi:predicted nucleic acid-binding protein